jgi:hypothetical protein
VYKVLAKTVTVVIVALGGLVVIVNAIGPSALRSNPAEDYGFLRVINIRSTTSFGGEVKPSALCPKFLKHVK